MRHRSNNTLSRKPIHGFTLVELLVVISIIALLVSILLPALNKAREAAKLVTCSTNERQHGFAFYQYAEDHNGRIVPGNHEIGETLYAGGGTIPTNMGFLLWGSGQYQGKPFQAFRVQGSGGGGYLPLPTSDHSVIYCPSEKVNLYDTPDAWGAFEPNWGRSGRFVMMGYEFRDSMDGSRVDSTGVVKAPEPGVENPLDKRGNGMLGAPIDGISRFAVVSDRFAYG